MKRKSKLFLSIGVTLVGTFLLTGCTKDFCSPRDKANMLYLFDYGVTQYYSKETKPDGAVKLELEGNKYRSLNDSEIYVTYTLNEDSTYYLQSVNKNALQEGSGMNVPSIEYWAMFDRIVLRNSIDKAFDDGYFGTASLDEVTWNLETIRLPFDKDIRANADKKGVLDIYAGEIKFLGTAENKKGKEVDTLYANFLNIDQEIRSSGKISLDDCPSHDYLELYKKTMNSLVSSYRSCLAIKSGDYGAYGKYGIPVAIEGKTWGEAFTRGTNFLFFEGLLVYPIGAFIDVLTGGILKAGVQNGWAQILSILIVTVIIRGLMLALTYKQTQSNAKMTELQPEISKIQAKYPNANTNTYEKQQMAAEMQKLYKKNKINPFMTLLTLFIQFPIFICVWGAMQGSAYLSTGSFLGLNLSASISSALFNANAWTAAGGYGAITALVLFILMSGTQAISMLLPQWLQKAAAAKAVKLGRNPAQKDQNNKMKWFTYIMLAMIIFMGFSLASGLGIYWTVGALFSIVQTLITQAVSNKKSKKRN